MIEDKHDSNFFKVYDKAREYQVKVPGCPIMFEHVLSIAYHAHKYIFRTRYLLTHRGAF